MKAVAGSGGLVNICGRKVFCPIIYLFGVTNAAKALIQWVLLQQTGWDTGLWWLKQNLCLAVKNRKLGQRTELLSVDPAEAEKEDKLTDSS